MSDATNVNTDIYVNLGVEPIQEGLLGSDEDQKEIIEYLSGEVEDVLGGKERERMVKKWSTWRRISEGRSAEDEKDYPWPGASNITVPLTMTDTHGLYSLLKATYSDRSPFFTVESPSEDHEHARVLQAALEAMSESRSHMDLRRMTNPIFYDLIRLGTQFVKVPWMLDGYTFKRTGDAGTETVTRVRRNGPAVIPIRIDDLLARPYWTDVQTMPWVGHYVHKFTYELQQDAQKGIYDSEAVEKVLAAAPTEWSEARLEEMARRGIDPSSADIDVRSIAETYLFWDLDGDGIPEDVKIWFHPETKTVLRVEYNDLGMRDIIRIPYINIPGQLYAIGTGWICEPLQEEMDALHNMRINAEHLHSLQMYATKTGSKLKGKMEFRPLKRFEFDNPNEDFRIIQFPGIGYENIQAEMLAREYANRATGASDYMMGFENKAIGTRSTLGGTEFLAAQGNRLFDAIAENVEEGMGEIGQVATFQLVRNKIAAKMSVMPLLPEKDWGLFEDILNVNVEDIPSKFNFRVKTTDSEKTEEMRTQQKMALFNLYSMYAEKMFQLAPILYGQNSQVPPQMKELGFTFFAGATKLMEDIFKHFDTRQTDDYLPYVEDINLLLDQVRELKEAQVGNVRANSRPDGGLSGGGGSPPGGAPQQSGMAGPQGQGVPAGGRGGPVGPQNQ